MTQFNPTNQESLTYAQCLGPAMEITDKEDARQYFNSYVAFIQKHLDINPNPQGLTAIEIAKINLGYYAGYYSNETRERVESLFECAHPVFGSIKENGAPTPKQAFNAGYSADNKTI